jgi:exosome complex exonuclease DIS3/RRP44
MNRRHRAAQLAGRASVQLHTLIFFANDSSKDEDAYVLDVETADKSDPILSVIVPRYGIEGRIKLPIDSEDPNLVRVPKEHKIIVRKASGGGKDSTIQVFDKVRVKIFVRQLQEYQRELVMELVTPSIASDPSKKREVERSEEQPHKQPTKRGRRK